MFYSPRYYEQFASMQFYSAIAKLDPEPAVPYKKHLVLFIMMMPDKFSLELDKLDFLTIKLSRHFWPPVFAEE
jgi:hypothetical protein